MSARIIPFAKAPDADPAEPTTEAKWTWVDPEEVEAYSRRYSRNMSPEEYAAASIVGISTDHFGQGPGPYRWAKRDADKDRALKFNEQDKALRLAVDTLNRIDWLLRFGGLRESETTSHHDSRREAVRDFNASSLAAFGEAMVRLRAFGANQL